MSTEETDVQEEFFGQEHITVIEPQKGWRTLDLKELWAYRELLYVLAQRDIKVRYKQTVLGVAWAVSNTSSRVMNSTAVCSSFSRDERIRSVPKIEHTHP